MINKLPISKNLEKGFINEMKNKRLLDDSHPKRSIQQSNNFMGETKKAKKIYLHIAVHDKYMAGKQI